MNVKDILTSFKEMQFYIEEYYCCNTIVTIFINTPPLFFDQRFRSLPHHLVNHQLNNSSREDQWRIESLTYLVMNYSFERIQKQFVFSHEL